VSAAHESEGFLGQWRCAAGVVGGLPTAGFSSFSFLVVAKSLERLRGRTQLFVVVKKIVGRVLLRGNR